MFEKHRICRDEKWYLAWPDVALTDNGALVCIFSECTHHGDRGYTRIMLCDSSDRGRTWSAKRPLTEGTDGTYFWNCARVSKLRDGRLVAICDRLDGWESGKAHTSCRLRENFLWFSSDGGATWSDPVKTPLDGIVPDKLLELPDGRWIISAQRADGSNGELVQYLRYSDDQGGSWSEDVVVGAREGYNLCEVTILPLDDKTLVAFHRENSKLGRPCQKTISRDRGETWSDAVDFPITACHRPVSGFLQDGRIFITHRHCQHGKGWTGWYTQNFFGALTNRESALAECYNDAQTRIIPIDYDRSPASDCGYSGWVQFPDGELYIVTYVMDDWPRGQIRGYSARPEEFILQPEE